MVANGSEYKRWEETGKRNERTFCRDGIDPLPGEDLNYTVVDWQLKVLLCLIVPER